jgi:uncharacterized protein (TIGR03067 family)
MVSTCCQGLLCLFALVATAAHAEVLELEGTVKAIDAKARSITIVRKTPKGEKVLELEVAKNAGDLSGLKEGDPVAFAYNPDVEVITKIEKGASASTAADMTAIQGLWKVIDEHEFGRVLTKEEMRVRNRHILIEGNAFKCDRVSEGKFGTSEGQFRIDHDTGAFTFAGTGPWGGQVERIGIYKLDDSVLTLCYRIKLGGREVERPKDFMSVSGDPGTMLFICKREE